MSEELGPRVRELVQGNLRDVPDFPEPGVLFRDITPLLANGPAFVELVHILADRYRGRVDAIAGLESRGFILAAPIATELGIGMLTVRKAGKLPGPVIGVDYGLEYGRARMELRPETVKADSRVLVVDDVLATGGTASAAVTLIRRCRGQIAGVVVLMELGALHGRDKLPGLQVEAGLLL